MQFTISAGTLLALVSAAQAQIAGFDAITTPLKDEAVPACAPYVINWQYTSAYPGTVTIQLLEGATPSTLQLGAIIASGIDNSLGAYTWAVDCALGDDATYGVKITYDNDATGVTFQYSNPFAITKSSGTATSSAAPTTAAPTTTAASEGGEGEEVQQTVYSTQYMTVTSCAATVTDCPARSTVVSSTSFPVVATGTGTGAGVPATDVAVTAATPATTLAPMYPAGNSTAGMVGVGGTVTLSTKTTTGGAGGATTTPVVTGGASGRVAAGGMALVAGLVAAVFVL